LEKLKSMQRVLLRKYLSPRLREVFDSCIKLESILGRMRRLSEVGILPSREDLEQTLMLCEEIPATLRTIVNDYMEEEKAKEFFQNLATLEKNMKTYRKDIIKMPITGDRTVMATKIHSIASAYSSFISARIYPIFMDLATAVIMNPKLVWESIEKYFAERAVIRIGEVKEEEEEEEEFERGRR